MSDKHPHLGPWSMLPIDTSKGQCPECGTAHPAEMPHNQQSLAYQYDFYGKHGRWPTWEDAMAHCTATMRSAWTRELLKCGVEIGGKEAQV